MGYRAECDHCNWRSVKYDSKHFAEMEVRDHHDEEDQCIFAEVVET